MTARALYSAGDGRFMYLVSFRSQPPSVLGLNKLQARNLQDAGHECQSKVLGLLDGVVDLLEQGAGLLLPEHRKFPSMQRFGLCLDVAGRSRIQN
jgi:hypothetical protein